jgi:rfaE bifunctional protein nucleotidyltransferase chain/domain
MMMEKVKTREELKKIVADARRAGKRVVFANGCFDMLHGGHISYLQSAKGKGDVLIVGVNSDVSTKKIKGEKRPIYPEEERLEILAAIGCIDYLILFDEESCDHLLRELRPDVHAKGTDYRRETVPERATSHELGIEIFIAGAPKENATKDIIRLILERYGKEPEG